MNYILMLVVVVGVLLLCGAYYLLTVPATKVWISAEEEEL